MPTAEQVRAAVAAYVESFNRRDKEAFLATLVETVVQEDPVGSAPRTGSAALGEFWELVFGLCTKIEFTPREVHVSGDEAALVFTIVQHRQDGGMVVLDGVDVFRIDDEGKIAALRGYATEQSSGSPG